MAATDSDDIGGQHCPRGQMRLDPGEDGPLDRQRLGHGLDHNIGRRDVLGPLHGHHARQDGVPRISRHRTLGHTDPERRRKPHGRRCPRLWSCVGGPHLVAGLHKNLPDAEPHRPKPDDPDPHASPGHVHRLRRRCRNAGFPSGAHHPR
jgi:hypothetical protein